MKIAVDASQLNSTYTGVGRYLYNLLKKLAPLDYDIKYTLLLSSDAEFDLDFKNIEKIILKTDRGNLYWQNFILNKELKNGNYDFLWSPNYYSPLFYRGRSILSVHDVSWKALPDNYSFPNRMIREILSRYSLKKASIVFTLSEFSKSEIIKYYGTDPSIIDVVHLAIDDSFKRSQDQTVQKFRKKYGITEGPVIGFLGSIFKRRNIDILIKSYQFLKNSYPELKLMLVGENFDTNVEPLLRNDPSIIWKKRISENEIKDFYSGIDLFVYISEYEGFGLPPLEALKCGTIPLLLRKTSLKEIFSDIALFIDDADPDKLSEKINEFLKDRNNISNNILGKFKTRENYFSWERVAEDYVKKLKNLFYTGPIEK
ncbi:MAG: glycosyltransferase family 1 protein [Acidobacteriota bacterium]